MNSPNKLQVSIDHTADWWLGNLDDPWFKALEGAIRDEWGVEPLRIREGGVSSHLHPDLLLAQIHVIVYTIGAVPREGVRLSCPSSPDGSKYGKLFKAQFTLTTG